MVVLPELPRDRFELQLPRRPARGRSSARRHHPDLPLGLLDDTPGRPHGSSAGQGARAGDYGLLVPVAQVRTPDDAAMLRAVLQDAGIRCTVGEAAGTDGASSTSLAVLVFRADADRARDLVSSRP
jgi:hypothetical protein